MSLSAFFGSQEDNVEAMLGSFVDIQPDGSDTP